MFRAGVYGHMQRERNDNLVELVAQSHGLYLRLRARVDYRADGRGVVRHAYRRYQRRVNHLSTTNLLV